MKERVAKFGIGEVVRHKVFPFRGVIFDVDPEFANTEEWWNSIPAEVRPSKDQPFYHLLADNDESEYVSALHAIQRQVANDDLFGLWLGSPDELVLAQDGISGFQPNKTLQTFESARIWRNDQG